MLRINKGSSNFLSGRQLYDEVSRHVLRLLKDDARRRIGTLDSNPKGLGELAPPVPPTEESSAGMDITGNAQDAYAGIIPPWGFRLRVVTRNGIGARSHWLTRSIGTLISSSDEVVKIEDGCNIAIDWHISIVKVNFLSSNPLILLFIYFVKVA